MKIAQKSFLPDCRGSAFSYFDADTANSGSIEDVDLLALVIQHHGVSQKNSQVGTPLGSTGSSPSARLDG